MIKRKKGIIFVISAPSGTGKTTVCRKIKERCKDIVLSVSSTSRDKRKGEKEGLDYYFISTKEFEKKIKENKFLEYVKILDRYYGTEMKNVENFLLKGKDVILSIDVNGAKRIKSKFPDSCLIFLLPPTISELKNRLEKRGTENKKQLAKRLQLAEKELKETVNYEYLVLNHNLENAAKEIRNIISAERNKILRYDIKQILKEINK